MFGKQGKRSGLSNIWRNSDSEMLAIPLQCSLALDYSRFPISLKADGQCLRFRHITCQSLPAVILIPTSHKFSFKPFPGFPSQYIFTAPMIFESHTHLYSFPLANDSLSQSNWLIKSPVIDLKTLRYGSAADIWYLGFWRALG